MRKFFAFLGLLGVIYALVPLEGAIHRGAAADPSQAQASPVVLENCDESRLEAAFRDHLSHIEVCGHAVIAKVLRDDLEGSRHQRFIVRLPHGQTVLIAYNIDIAPRIPALRAGAPVEFVGEYEWNEQGGVVHWTHHDPSGRHSSGWLRYAGQRYQ